VFPLPTIGTYLSQAVSLKLQEISLQDKDFWNLHAIFNIHTLLKPQILAYDPYGPSRVKHPNFVSFFYKGVSHIYH